MSKRRAGERKMVCRKEQGLARTDLQSISNYNPTSYRTKSKNVTKVVQRKRKLSLPKRQPANTRMVRKFDI